jgi:hypothetical protein
MVNFSWRIGQRTSHCVSVVVAALVLTGCNAIQEVNLSSRAAPGVVAGPNYNPYNPISYAQNNTGNRSAGRRRLERGDAEGCFGSYGRAQAASGHRDSPPQEGGIAARRSFRWLSHFVLDFFGSSTKRKGSPQRSCGLS